MATSNYFLLLALHIAFTLTPSSIHVLAHETLSFPTLEGPLIEPSLSHLNVHLIPHTHDDIGYIKTLDQYYYDSEKEINMEGVQYILDSVFPMLASNPEKRFIYVEIGFFKRWWNEQNNATKSVVQQLLQAGQFEFINGGYCMNDEADVYYEDSIDQMTLGHQFLLENFNVTPQIGWHIDPFGHASAQAALFAQMGFQAFFINRIDYQDKANRLANSGLEMVWVPQTSQGIENGIFTHVTYYHYASPMNFDFDVLGPSQPIRSDPTLEEYDLPTRADEFIAWFREMSVSYKASELMHTEGGDFQYMAPHMNFNNVDKLFEYIKNTPAYNVNVFYSTPSQYLAAIQPLNIQYPTKTDDFFPYADLISCFWTGYFTSRVSVKGLIRQEGRLLQAAKRLATQEVWNQASQFAVNNFTQIDQALGQLEEAMAIAQHHDAVTGTERQPVAEDYKLRLAIGDNAVKQSFLYPYFEERIMKELGQQVNQMSMCSLNTSAVFCDVTFKNLGQGSSVLLTAFNSAPSPRISTIRLKVPNGQVQVTTSAGADLPTDIICSNSTDTSDCDLFFTDQFEGFQVSYYYLISTTQSNQISPTDISLNSPYLINSNQTITVEDLSTFAFSYCQDSSLTNCYSSQFNLKYNYYEAFQGVGQPAGAYIFRPSDKTKSSSLSYDVPVSGQVYQGKNLLHFHIVGTQTITDIRIYNDMTNGIEVQTFVNSISVSDGQGKEVIMMVQVPSIQNNNTFYTDSMGMEMQKRILNYRPTWNFVATEPVAGNYYPVQSTICIQNINSGESLAIIPDRAQGGSSINQGEIELLIHRRLLHDDLRGVGEALNELDWNGQGLRQWMTHTLLFTKPNFLTTSYRQIQLNNDMSTLVLLAPAPKASFIEVIPPHTNKLGMVGDFPPMVKILSRPLSTSKFLLRFQNMDESNSQNVSTSVFTSEKFSHGSVVEMSLSANQPKADMVKNKFNWNGLDLNNPTYAKTDYLNSGEFELRPLEIRTFIVDFNQNINNEIISD